MWVWGCGWESKLCHHVGILNNLVELNRSKNMAQKLLNKYTRMEGVCQMSISYRLDFCLTRIKHYTKSLLLSLKKLDSFYDTLFSSVLNPKDSILLTLAI